MFARLSGLCAMGNCVKKSYLPKNCRLRICAVCIYICRQASCGKSPLQIRNPPTMKKKRTQRKWGGGLKQRRRERLRKRKPTTSIAREELRTGWIISLLGGNNTRWMEAWGPWERQLRHLAAARAIEKGGYWLQINRIRELMGEMGARGILFVRNW